MRRVGATRVCEVVVFGRPCDEPAEHFDVGIAFRRFEDDEPLASGGRVVEKTIDICTGHYRILTAGTLEGISFG